MLDSKRGVLYLIYLERQHIPWIAMVGSTMFGYVHTHMVCLLLGPSIPQTKQALCYIHDVV